MGAIRVKLDDERSKFLRRRIPLLHVPNVYIMCLVLPWKQEVSRRQWSAMSSIEIDHVL